MSTPRFDRDIELKKIDLVSEEHRTGYYTAIGLLFSVLLGIIGLIGAFSFSLMVNLITVPLWVVYTGLLSLTSVGAVVAIVTLDFIRIYKRQLPEFDELLKDVYDKRSLGTVGDILSRIKGRTAEESVLRSGGAYARTRWKGILLALLTIASTGYGLARWEGSQTFDGLTLYCISSRVTRYPSYSYPYERGEFTIFVGLKNPNLFPVNVVWSATPILNGSNYFGGLLRDVVPGFQSHVSKMTFEFIPPLANYTLDKVVSYERYSIWSDTFAEPRVFFIESEQSLHFGNNVTYYLANRLPSILWSINIEHSDLLQSQETTCSLGDMA